MGSYTTYSGSLNFYGEVVNQSAVPLGGIALLIELYNDRDERLARGASPGVSVNVLQPGGKAIWDATMTDHPATWARTEIHLGLVAGIAGTQMVAADDYSDLALSDFAARPDPNRLGGALDVKGTVTNTGGGIARGLEFSAALYDDTGRLLSVATAGSMNPVPDSSNLGPGASYGFRVKFLQVNPPLPTNAAKVETYVKANKPIP